MQFAIAILFLVMDKTAVTSYTFRLFAPNNIDAAVIVDHLDWKPHPMTKGDDGWFIAEIGLADGDYQYKFNIRSKSWFNEEDAWVTITDPRATDIDPATQNSILRIRNGVKAVDEYVWRHDDVPLPVDAALVIYEMHVSDFSGGEADPFTRGKYPDVIAKLDYLAGLGINAIELMPLKTSPGDFNWGYSPIHYFAPEPTYGTTAELKKLVDECHARGIRVIVDCVYNHASTENPLTQIDHDYWFRREGKDPEQNWGPEFNYEYFDDRFGKCPALAFIDDSIRSWIREYHIDGIRFDAAKQIDNFDALRSFVANAREMSPSKPFFTVAEFIPPVPEVTEPEGPVESCWNDSFMYAVVDYLKGSDTDIDKIKNALDPTQLGFSGSVSVTNYLANHDQNRLFLKLGESGILDDELYLRAKLGAFILLTAVGVPMIWMGEEFGEYVPMSEQPNKIHWTLLEAESNQSLHDYYGTLIRLRTQNDALYSSDLTFVHEDSENNVLAYIRGSDETGRAACIINLSDSDLNGYEFRDLPVTAGMTEMTVGHAFEIIDQKIKLDLPRRTGLLFAG